MGDTDWVKGQLAPSLPPQQRKQVKENRTIFTNNRSAGATYLVARRTSCFGLKNNAGVCQRGHKVGQRRPNNVVCLRC